MYGRRRPYLDFVWSETHAITGSVITSRLRAHAVKNDRTESRAPCQRGGGGYHEREGKVWILCG